MAETKLEYWTRQLMRGASGAGFDLDKHECAELLRLLDSPSYVPSEPVAWRWRVKGGSWNATTIPWSADDLEAAKLEQEPLFISRREG